MGLMPGWGCIATPGQRQKYVENAVINVASGYQPHAFFRRETGFFLDELEWISGMGIQTLEEYQAYAPWFASARRLRALAADLEALSLAEMARAEGWANITPGTQAPARTKLARVPREPGITPKTPGDRPA